MPPAEPLDRSQPLPPSVVELPGPFEHEYVHTRGLRLHAAVAGSPEDPLILLLHGAYGGWFDYEKVIAPLAEAGYHVAAVDLRGYGMSDKPPVPANALLGLLVSDIAGTIAALGHDDGVVVGADTGGTVAWALASSHPERVRALVSVSAAHAVDLRRSISARPWNFTWMILRSLQTRLPARVARWSRSWREHAQLRHLQLNTTTQFHRTLRFAEVLNTRLNAAAIGNTVTAAMHTGRILVAPMPLREISAEISADTLLIHPPQGLWKHVARRARARLSGSVEQESVPGAKNMPHIETPEAFAATVLDFLESR